MVLAIRLDTGNTSNGNRVTDTGSDTMPTQAPLIRCRPWPQDRLRGRWGLFCWGYLAGSGGDSQPAVI